MEELVQDPVSPHERMLQAGLDLFAGLGYDGTTGEMIADAAGVSTDDIQMSFGGKLGLFRTVLERAQQADVDLLMSAEEHDLSDPNLVHWMIDSYLDHCCNNPKIVALWMQRRILDAVDLSEIEKKYIYPKIAKFVSLAGDRWRPGPDPMLIAWMIMWFIQTFVHSGIPDEQGVRHGCGDAAQVQQLRRTLHEVIDALTIDSVPDLD
jgi:AcrR family transcriptional regulator